MKTHKELDAWKDSMDFVVAIYSITRTFPKEELFSLVTQLRRAAVSIPSNISEGAARNSTRDFIRFLRISISSIAEVETQLIISRRLEFVRQPEFDQLTNQVIRIRAQLSGLIKVLERQLSASS